MTAKTEKLAIGAIAADANPASAVVMEGVQVLSVASSVIVESIKALYATAKSINEFIDEHIREMKDSENHTVSRSGNVLEAAKYGFGIGFISPVIIMAAGQMILGNPLSAMATVVTAPINPIAMTCGAIGAIYYGWSVLSEEEKQEILNKLSKGLEIGIEMIKSVIRFVTEKMKELLSPENLHEIKKYISNAASVFGRTLADVTRTIIDRVADGLDVIKKKTGEAVDRTGSAISESIDVIREHGGKAIEKITSKRGNIPEIVRQEPTIGRGNVSPARLSVKLNSKGQLTIPSSLRQQLGLTPDSEIQLVMEGDVIVLRKAQG